MEGKKGMKADIQKKEKKEGTAQRDGYGRRERPRTTEKKARHQGRDSGRKRGRNERESKKERAKPRNEQGERPGKDTIK